MEQSPEITPPAKLPSLPDNYKEDCMDKFKNMDPNQMDMMTKMLQGMDNDTLKSMMKSQTGMEMDDSQMTFLKSSMNSDTLSKMQGQIKSGQMGQ